MNAKQFKQAYLKWSNAIALCIPCMMMAVVLCDYLLGFDFSKDMYVLAFIATSCILSFLSITWISVLNLESKFMKGQNIRVIDEWECSEETKDSL